MYGCHQEANGKHPVIVEGHIDAVAVRRLGYVSLAVMGSHLSPIKAAHVARYGDRCIIWPDSDNQDCVETWAETFASVGVEAVWPTAPYSPMHPAGKLDPDWLVNNDPEWIQDGIRELQ